MSNLVFPSNLRGLGYSVVRTPEESVIIQTSPSFSETRILQSQNPIWHWELYYNFLTDNMVLSQGPTYTDLRAMLGFYLQVGGNFDSFLYTDFDDHAVTNATTQQLVQDSSSGIWYTPLQRDMGGFFEDVTDLNPINGSGLVVTANGVAKTLGTDFTLLGPGLAIPGYSFAGMYLKWQAPTATPTGPIKAAFSFYFRVRFEMNKQAFEKWSNLWWSAGGQDTASHSEPLKLVTAKPPGV